MSSHLSLLGCRMLIKQITLWLFGCACKSNGWFWKLLGIKTRFLTVSTTALCNKTTSRQKSRLVLRMFCSTVCSQKMHAITPSTCWHLVCKMVRWYLLIALRSIFASSWAIASCQVSGTETPWRKNGFWIVLFFFLLRQNRFEQKIVTDQGQQLWFSDGPGWSRFLHHRTEVQKTKKGSKHHRFTSRKSRVYITIYIIYQRGVWDVFFLHYEK